MQQHINNKPSIYKKCKVMYLISMGFMKRRNNTAIINVNVNAKGCP